MSERMRQRQIKRAILVFAGLIQWIYASPVFTFENNEKWDLQANDAVYELHYGLNSISSAHVYHRFQKSVNSRISFDERKDEFIHLAEATGFTRDGKNRITLFDPRETTLSPKCASASIYSRSGCWLATEGRSDCWVWNPSPQPEETVSWDGRCVDGLISGKGSLIWRFFRNGRELISWQAGRYREGKEHGHFVYKNRSGKIWEGNYENGEPHGLWMMREASQDLYPIADCRQFGRETSLDTCIQEANAGIARKLKSTVALRYGPSTEFGLTGNILTTGTSVAVTHTNSEWVWVKATNGHVGFIPIALLTEIVSDKNFDTQFESMSEEEMKLWILRNLIDSLKIE